MSKIRNPVDKENDNKNGNKRGEGTGKLVPLTKQRQPEFKEVYSKNVDIKFPTIPVKSNPVEEKPVKAETIPLTNTQRYVHLYAENILYCSSGDNRTLGNFLVNHEIDNQLRARMLDWLVEVCSSYKFEPKTYFSSVQLMDQYFKKQTDRLPISKLHITGVTAMVIATKMDEVYPLKIRTVYEKIVHKKIEKRELIEMEGVMSVRLDFYLNMWTFFDLAVLKLHSHWFEGNEEVLGEIEVLCEHIGKFMVFSYELSGCYPIEVLADSLLHTALQVYGAEKIRQNLGDRPLPQPTEQCQNCCDLILTTIRGFKATFRNLNNIFKFGEATVLQRLEHYLQSH